MALIEDVGVYEAGHDGDDFDAEGGELETLGFSEGNEGGFGCAIECYSRIISKHSSQLHGIK